MTEQSLAELLARVAELEQQLAAKQEALAAANKALQVQIGERTRLEESSRQRRRQQEEAFELAHLGAWEWDRATGALRWNTEMARLCDRDPKLAPPRLDELPELFPPPDSGFLAAAIESAVERGEAFDLELELIQPDGNPHRMRALGRPRSDRGGMTVGLIGTLQEITEVQRGEQPAAGLDVQLFGGFLELTQEGLWAIDLDARTTHANHQMASMLGSTVEEMLGKSIFEFMDTRGTEITKRAIERSKQGIREVHELDFLAKGGRRVQTNLSAAPLKDDQGHCTGTVAVVSDISERGRVKREHLQAQKIEALGQLAGGIAHDFNNILAEMLMQLNMIRLQPTTPEELGQTASELMAAANRAAGLTRKLLLFSRRQYVNKSRFDLNAVVLDLMRLFERLLGPTIALVVDTADRPLPVDADAAMIEQVVMALCVNARDAMPGGGRLTVSTRFEVLDAEEARRHSSARPGQFACIRVVDTGSGMEPSVIEHLFEPFFTTKEPGKGVGLGLATVHGIVARHEGWVEVQSQVGQGSAFSVYLPRPSDADTYKPKSTALPPRGGNERILVVEDEDGVRRTTLRCLRLLGYRVREAANGVEALRLWDQEDGKFDLLFSDMVMPEGISGLDLCTELRQKKPGLRAIIVSGYSAEILNDEALAKRDILFLAKPFDIPTLAATVRMCLDRKP